MAEVGEWFDVSGDSKKEPPANILVATFELGPSGLYYPKREVRFQNDGKRWRWEARRISVGSEPGDERDIIVAAMGQDWKVLWDYFFVVVEKITKIREDKKDSTIKIPGLPALPPGAIECARIKVLRRSVIPE